MTFYRAYDSLSSQSAEATHSRSNRPFGVTHFPFRFLERIPKPQRFISCSSHNRLAIRTHGKVENTIVVASQSGNLGHGRIFPDVNLVRDGSARIAVSRNDLVGVFGPHEITHLKHLSALLY